MKRERLYGITIYLLNHGRTSAKTLAEYFEVDPTLVRILTAALCTTGTGLLLYIVAAVVMPERVE